MAQIFFKFHAWFKKCHFGNVSEIGWIGHALLVQPSKPAHRIFFLFSLLILIFFLNMKPLSDVAPGLLVNQVQIQAVCSAKNKLTIYIWKAVSLLLSHTVTFLKNNSEKMGVASIVVTAVGMLLTKGQLISKYPFGVFKSPKKQTKFL